MNVHSGAGHIHYRFRHKSSVQIMSLSDSLCTILQRKDLVGYIQTVPVIKIYFILAKPDLVVRRFNLDSKILESAYYLLYDLVSFMRRKVKIAVIIYGRGPYFVIGSEQIEFRLRPDIINKALVCRLSSCLFKNKSGVSFERFTVRAVDITYQPCGRAVFGQPRHNSVSCHVWLQKQIALLYSSKAFDRRAVKPDPVG